MELQFPFIDMYCEVEENYRQKGFGSLIAQELKKEAYRMNRIPAARCNVKNKASKATLVKSWYAGLRPSACRQAGVSYLLPLKAKSRKHSVF